MGISDLCNDLVRFEPLNVHLDGRVGKSFVDQKDKGGFFKLYVVL